MDVYIKRQIAIGVVNSLLAFDFALLNQTKTGPENSLFSAGRH